MSTSDGTEVWRRWSARRTLSQGQRVALVAGTGGLVLAAGLTRPRDVLALGFGGFATLFLITTVTRCAYFYAGWRSVNAGQKEPDPDPDQWPMFTVLAALYREANVVGRLFEALAALDYEPDRLEVLLLLEEDDLETIAACRQHLRPGWRVVVVPEGTPKTKPRALNHGLTQASGELFTVFDAEDRPEPDQLRKAARAFASAPPQVAALQARLDFYNVGQNLLTRLFTCDYAIHFGLYLPGLAAAGHPMPLGGTSTHFRTTVIRDVGGWDQWNVTEDCELGMRLAAAGYRTGVLDSTTHEEAVPSVAAWVRQRSRWIKGFAQTGLVLLRHPVLTARAMGVNGYVAALLAVACVPVILVLQVVFWIILWTYFGLRGVGADVLPIERLFPAPLLFFGTASLLVGNFAMLLVQISALYQQSRWHLMRFALLIPLYWALTSVGAWKGVLQLLRRPHYWEKTTHGVSEHTASATP